MKINVNETGSTVSLASVDSGKVFQYACHANDGTDLYMATDVYPKDGVRNIVDLEYGILFSEMISTKVIIRNDLIITNK